MSCETLRLIYCKGFFVLDENVIQSLTLTQKMAEIYKKAGLK